MKENMVYVPFNNATFYTIIKDKMKDLQIVVDLENTLKGINGALIQGNIILKEIKLVMNKDLINLTPQGVYLTFKYVGGD